MDYGNVQADASVQTGTTVEIDVGEKV